VRSLFQLNRAPLTPSGAPPLSKIDPSDERFKESSGRVQFVTVWNPPIHTQTTWSPALMLAA